MQRHELLAHVRTLGRAFASRDMRAHAKRLRVYYLAVEHGLTERHVLDVQWNEDFVAEWLALLAIPPFDKVYDRYPITGSCPRCAQAPSDNRAAGLRTMMTFPGGAKLHCLTCLHTWVGTTPESTGPPRRT